MAAYAALASLMNNMEQIMNHPRLSTCLDKNQIESLGEKLDFFLDFVESDINAHGGISKEEADDLESQIASAAHAAEDVIESHIVDRILAGSTLDDGETSSSFLLDLQKQVKVMKKKVMKVQEKIRSKVDKSRQRQKVILVGSTDKSPSFLLDLQKIIEDMNSIKKKVMKVKEERGFKDQQPTYSMPASSSTSLITRNTTMVGFDDELIQLMDMLTGQQADRQIISIVGMGGMGKTTLARNVYENTLIMQHFDIRTWATISQEYNVREIFLQLLSFQGQFISGTVDELGERLYKSLSGRRYLIILDDMWSIEVWDKIKFFFPNNGDRSRVILTTRLSDVATYCGSSCFRMNFLDEDKSWNLFCENVFGYEDCPLELEKVGREIAKLCKGLPLSIAVIGGLLRKSYRTIGYWQNVAENINSILNSGENEQCLNVLTLSYSHLPDHLKPCFLYMGIFDEDCEIQVSQIIKLWVAEGFLKPNGAPILEEIAEGYLKDLVDRNLVLIGRHRKNGKIRSCRIHDLLRDLCISVAEKQQFFCVPRPHSVPQGIERERRFVCQDFMSKDENTQLFHALQSASLARSQICRVFAPSVMLRLLRVLDTNAVESPEDIFQNFNLRFLAYDTWGTDYMSKLPSSLSLLWNLQTLIINNRGNIIIAPSEIWKMPQLRHIQCKRIYLPDPPASDEQADLFVMRNLQTLAKVVNFRLSEEVCKRIPNIKKLHVRYDIWKGFDDCLYLCNLGRLHKLESLNVKFFIPTKLSRWGHVLVKLKRRFLCSLNKCLWKKSVAFPSSLNKLYSLKKNLTFPSSLNKLYLTSCGLHWEDLTMIGSLPQLEVLKLETVMGSEWSPVEGEFLRLKFLRIYSCDLISWNADSSHFPALEKLVLDQLVDLNEIPSGIGDIPTLQLICLIRCSESATISAMKIKEEQESLENDGLQIRDFIFPSCNESFRERWKQRACQSTIFSIRWDCRLNLNQS